jgi:hypothetical protein
MLMTAIVASLSLGQLIANALPCGRLAEGPAQSGSYADPSEVQAHGLAKSAALPNITKTWAGTFKVLVIRVGFADSANCLDTITINKTTASLDTLYGEMSRNKFQFKWKTYGPILQSPGTIEENSADFPKLQAWIAAQLTAAGFKQGSDYDFYLAHLPRMHRPFIYAGLSDGAGGNWINGKFGDITVGHELGHTLGLVHAHAIQAGGTDTFGTPGNDSHSAEYGNPFDIMGNGLSKGQFTTLSKWCLHKGRTIALRVPSDNPKYNYWLEYRTGTLGTLDTAARLGTTVMFQGFRTQQSDPKDAWFLDTSPGSNPDTTKGLRFNFDLIDGVLAVGKSLQDKYGKTSFKTLAINNGTWNQDGWVDVQIDLSGTVSLNRPIASGMRALRKDENPAIDMLGRTLDGLAPDRTLSIKVEDGSIRLIGRGFGPGSGGVGRE